MSVLTTRATAAAGAVAMVIDPNARFQLEQICIHLDGVGTAGTLTVTLDAGSGATYDTVLLSQDMTAITNLVWIPTRAVLCTHVDDHIDIAWANANNCDYGIEVHFSLIN